MLISFIPLSYQAWILWAIIIDASCAHAQFFSSFLTSLNLLGKSTTLVKRALWLLSACLWPLIGEKYLNMLNGPTLNSWPWASIFFFFLCYLAIIVSFCRLPWALLNYYFIFSPLSSNLPNLALHLLSQLMTLVPTSLRKLKHQNKNF